MLVNAKTDPNYKTPQERSGGNIRNPFVEDLVEAIGKLEIGNKDHWTEAGLPEIKGLKLFVNFKVTSELRDKAWERFKVVNQIK